MARHLRFWLRFGAPLLLAILWFIASAGTWWWLYAWGAYCAFQLLVLFLFPTVIMPLFNKFTPLEDGPLRQAIALHLRANRGIACDAQQIFIVGGAQHAFQLVGAMLLNPGDKVWFENPGAIGARNSLIAAGADLVPVPVDESGLSVSALAALCEQQPVRALYLTPHHQYPTTAPLSPRCRAMCTASCSRNALLPLPGRAAITQSSPACRPSARLPTPVAAC